jgi:hypothetical protein
MHGKMQRLDKGAHRFEVSVRFSPGPYLANIYNQAAMEADLLSMKVPETLSYYLQEWNQEAITVAGALVRRTLLIALLEGTELLYRERAELDWDMETKMWKWPKKPNFLTHFNQWWEYQLNEERWEQPKIRHYVG